MTKFVKNVKIPFDIEEILKDVDVDKVASIRDASENMKTKNKVSIAPFSRHIFKEHLPHEIIDFIDSLGFIKYGCNLLIQYTGECSPNHYDLFLHQVRVNKNTTRDDYFRYVIFLTDRIIGQFYHVRDKQIDWNKGDLYYQDTYEYHNGGNISPETRYTIIIDSLKSLHPYEL